MSLDFLRQLPLFQGLPEDDLRRLHDMAEPVELDPGQTLMREGAREDWLFLILEGECEVSKRSGERDVVIALRGAGEVMGEMALLGETPRTATVTAIQPMHLLRLDERAFQAVLRSSPAAALATLKTVTSRLRNTQSVLQQHEKLSALGTLAAGLAHEINNPAAAIQSAANQLEHLIPELAQANRQVGEIQGSGQAQHVLKALGEREVQDQREKLGALEQSDREQELEDWLVQAGVSEPWHLVPSLVAAGWGPKDLTPAKESLPGYELQTIAQWLALDAEALALIREVTQASLQVSSIVQSVKSYAYLDQGPTQVLDIHSSLEDTFVILRHKMGEGITIVREYAGELPRVEGRGSELTQVWSNLIDNAIDAMNGKGTLKVATRALSEGVEVRICDDGPGIPENLKDHIFEPFFTTKAPGRGTGLGLHMVYNIVVQRHKGSITLETQPGTTCFVVTLPCP